MKFIKKLIDKWYISKAGWRIIETAIICWFTYILWAIISWEVLSFQALLVATITPIYLWMSKAQRDLLNKKK
jgi:Flp pilus assembly protein TadB